MSRGVGDEDARNNVRHGYEVDGALKSTSAFLGSLDVAAATGQRSWLI